MAGRQGAAPLRSPTSSQRARALLPHVLPPWAHCRSRRALSWPHSTRPLPLCQVVAGTHTAQEASSRAPGRRSRASGRLGAIPGSVDMPWARSSDPPRQIHVCLAPPRAPDLVQSRTAGPMKPRFAEISSADGRQNGAELAPRDNGRGHPPVSVSGTPPIASRRSRGDEWWRKTNMYANPSFSR